MRAHVIGYWHGQAFLTCEQVKRPGFLTIIAQRCVCLQQSSQRNQAMCACHAYWLLPALHLKRHPSIWQRWQLQLKGVKIQAG